MHELIISGTPVRCPLCDRYVPTFNTHDDERLRYTDHNCDKGPRAGRECDNTGQLVEAREQVEKRVT